MTRPLLTNTERLFLLLLRAHPYDVICDVGSLDGAHALVFRRARPRARILAFEANPHNVEEMCRNPVLREQNIELQPVAVGDRDGPADFHVVSGPEDTRAFWRPLSSTRSRAQAPAPWWNDLSVTTNRVNMVRVDSVLTDVAARTTQ